MRSHFTIREYIRVYKGIAVKKQSSLLTHMLSKHKRNSSWQLNSIFESKMLLIICSIVLLLLLFSLDSSAFVLLQTESIDDQCGPEMVFAEGGYDTRDAFCLPKVHLNGECELDEQCNSKTPNSFCALLDDYLQNDLYQDIRPVCLCRDGFTPSMGNLHCVPVQYCTFDGFNSAMEQMDCKDNQFCREGVCLCIPYHGLDHTGQCVPVRSNFSLPDSLLKANESTNLSDRIVNKLLSWFVPQKRSNTAKCCALFLLLEYLTGLALFLLGQIIWSLCLK